MTMTQERPVTRPLPYLDDPVTLPFFEAARRGEIVIPRCQECRTWVFYPQVYCHVCHSNRMEWERVSGKGTVYSYTEVMHPLHPGFAQALPLLVVLVDLDDAPGVRLVSNMVDCRYEDMRVGMPVTATFADVDGVVLPLFRKADAAG